MLDTTRDVRGPGQGANNFYARELQQLVQDLKLTDGWLTLHGVGFVAICACGIPQSRIDRVYVPKVFLANLQACEVVQLAPSQQKLSDHAPLPFTFNVSTTTRIHKPWRMDPNIFHEDESISVLQTELVASLAEVGFITPTTWDHLKSRWRLLAQQARKARHARFTAKMNEILRRIQIIERA